MLPFDEGVPRPPRAGLYQTILADPPWLERGGGQIKRGADRHYPLMSALEIAALPVAAWAAPDCHLYLWVTNNFLPDGLQVMRAWGFRYVTKVTWTKTKEGLVVPEDEVPDDDDVRVGLGQYFRGCSEDCLFGVRGQPPYRLRDDGKRAQGRTWFAAPRGVHSEKPERLRQMAELVSHGPRLEMFARRPADGWDVWGNEVPIP